MDVERLTLPEDLAGPGAHDFLEFSELTDAIQREVWGHDDRCSPPQYRLRVWRGSDYESTALFLVRDRGRMVGRAVCQLPLTEDLDRARVRAEVLDEYRGRGIGRLLLGAAIDEARRRGRTVASTFTEHPAAAMAEPKTAEPNTAEPDTADTVLRTTGTRAGTQVVVSSTGTGTLPAGARSVRFAQAAGFALSQVVRSSELDLAPHGEAWPALEARAAARASGEYELLTWQGIPAEYRAGMAELFARMSVDAPQGEDRCEAAVWDAARVDALEEMLSDAGTAPLYAVARHRASGQFAAYTALWVRRGKEAVADQDDTLVRIGHRGRSLGLWIKLANLAQYRAAYPSARKVITINAEENAPMLAINAALGFRPAGYEGEWYRRLA